MQDWSNTAQDTHYHWITQERLKEIDNHADGDCLLEATLDSAMYWLPKEHALNSSFVMTNPGEFGGSRPKEHQRKLRDELTTHILDLLTRTQRLNERRKLATDLDLVMEDRAWQTTNMITHISRLYNVCILLHSESDKTWTFATPDDRMGVNECPNMLVLRNKDRRNFFPGGEWNTDIGIAGVHYVALVPEGVDIFDSSNISTSPSNLPNPSNPLNLLRQKAIANKAAAAANAAKKATAAANKATAAANRAIAAVRKLETSSQPSSSTSGSTSLTELKKYLKRKGYNEDIAENTISILEKDFGPAFLTTDNAISIAEQMAHLDERNTQDKTTSRKKKEPLQDEDFIENIEIIVHKYGVTNDQAIRALNKRGGDLASAIKYLLRKFQS